MIPEKIKLEKVKGIIDYKNSITNESRIKKYKIFRRRETEDHKLCQRIENYLF